MGPEKGETWAVRIFRDPETALRVFKVLGYGANTISLQDQETKKVQFFSKSDVQFLEMLEAAPREEISTPQQRDSRQDKGSGGSGQPGHNARVRPERDR